MGLSKVSGFWEDNVWDHICEHTETLNLNLTPEEWSIEGGHLTPTMKSKRKVIKEMYKDLYEKLYGRS